MTNRIKLLIASVLLSVSASWAADVTIAVENAPAETVFAKLMEQTGKNFIYRAGLLDGMRVTLRASGQPLERVLATMFAGSDIAWSIKGDNVTLRRRKAAAPATVKVSGFVREALSGEPVAGAIVAPAGNPAAGTATNAQGFYSLAVAAGADVGLTARCVGWGMQTLRLGNLSRATTADFSLEPSHELAEVVVVGSGNNARALESAEIGSHSFSGALVKATPAIFGESDVVKTLQLEPGVSAGVEGLAGMYVHGGGSDENLYMLDNIPLYQVNHLGGLFSAFNTSAVRNVEFYKSTFPARYDGRLSSFMDVNTVDGSLDRHSGEFTLGLISGALSVKGPVWRGHTSYAISLRRTWLDVLTAPAMAIANRAMKDEDDYFRYDFSDLNAKINHHFSERSQAYLMLYYGEDFLKAGNAFDYGKPDANYSKDINRLKWGNTVVSAGWKYVVSPTLFSELTAAFTRYGSTLRRTTEDGTNVGGVSQNVTRSSLRNRNSIDDWILKADFDFRPRRGHRVAFGVSAVRHVFHPSDSHRSLSADGFRSEASDSIAVGRAWELGAYIGDDWRIGDALRISAGVHASLFAMDSKTRGSVSPRLSLRYAPAAGWALKASYGRTVQYVHQLTTSSISLPTDQWMPLAVTHRPQTADKISAGVYRSFASGRYALSVEGYMKWMRNLIDYHDDYALVPPGEPWYARTTVGSGRSRGVDMKFSKETGLLTGHISYSLLWADRLFPDKNGGRRFPARFDNRHKINIALDWHINDRWELGATWTGMSGNRVTLPLQCWNDPGLGPWHYDMSLAESVNNYRLPFYHRLDLSCRRNTRHGYWSFSVYNAYCNMNVIAVRRDYSNEVIVTPDGNIYGKPVFQKVRLLPIIPSFSYTWIF